MSMLKWRILGFSNKQKYTGKFYIITPADGVYENYLDAM